MGSCLTKDILKEFQRLVATEAEGNPAAFRHILIIMPTLNELCRDGHGNTIKNRDPTHGPIFKTLAETLAPMKYKLVIGPGDEVMWGTQGQLSFNQMASEIYEEFQTADIPVCSSMPLYRQLTKKNQFHSQASWPSLSKFPKYLLAAIELAVGIATFKEAAMCLGKPAE